MAGVGNALKQYMAEFGIILQELSDQSRVPRSTIADILRNPAKRPRIDTLERIADALSRISGRSISVTDLSGGVEPGPSSERLDWLWEARFNQMDLDDLVQMRGRSIQERAAWCVRQMISAIGVTETADRLGYSTDDIQQILAGADPKENLLSTLEKRGCVPANFVLNGDPGSTNLALRSFLQSNNAGAWLSFFTEATKYNIPPEFLLPSLRPLIELAKLKTPAK